MRPSSGARELLQKVDSPGPFLSKAAETFSILGEKVVALDSDHKEFHAVQNLLKKGCKGTASLTALHKVVNSQPKMAYFIEQLRAMRRCRGNPNVKYAWHGSSAEAITSIVLCGFCQRPKPLNGHNYGCGTYLAPCQKLEISALYADIDSNQEQHLLLCEVILGETEEIPPGSRDMCLPSSTSYDSGVDNIEDPNVYLIWPPFINSRIIPWYIVSFVTETSCPSRLYWPLEKSQRLHLYDYRTLRY